MPVHHAVIPCLRFTDAPGAIDFLCRAFGFERHAVFADETDASIVHHAQLVFHGQMVMLGSDMPGAPRDRYGWKTVAEAGGVTGTVYVVVEDVDAHCAVARAAGAEIVDEPKDNDGYPGRGYTARDTGGHIWSFGSYDPFTSAAHQ